ncbi:NEQ112 [Nanoarchaeum equitans Kin4-M]|uniref:NEQ112 n=1 Tax=Nanoarchaeum equitans (strain Kin4-M) TaxID=228908 RepID=Q74MK9_NANEQ|nr:NEQ112 [Nanoarchaeum equitans Kin4-M]
MPANLTPEFIKAWEKAKAAKTLEERLKYLYEALYLCPKHKGTEKLLALLKKEISKTRQEIEKKKEEAKKLSKKGISKEGDIMVVLVGGPNSGKTYFINQLVNTDFPSTELPYETVQPISVIYNYKGAKIQLIEYPSHFPKEYSYLLKNADLIILFDEEGKRFLEKMGIKLGEKENKIKIIKEPTGGIKIMGPLKATKEIVSEILKNYGIYNATVIAYKEATISDLIDYLEGSSHKPYIDLTKEKIDNIGEEIIKRANKILVFTKDTENGLVLDKGSTVKDLVERIHKDMLKNFRFARVWGKSVKHQGQRVGLDHRLEHYDRVIIYTK